jgi:hypothetical protein
MLEQELSGCYVEILVLTKQSRLTVYDTSGFHPIAVNASALLGCYAA